MFNLKNPIAKAVILGGAGMAGTKIVEHVLTRFGIGVPAQAPGLPPSPPHLGAGVPVSISVDQDNVEQTAAAVVRGGLSSFLAPLSIFANLLGPPGPGAAVGKPCCADCKRKGTPLGCAGHAPGTAGIDDADEDPELLELGGFELDDEGEVTALGFIPEMVTMLINDGEQNKKLKAEGRRRRKDKAGMKEDLADANAKIDALEKHYTAELRAAEARGDARAAEFAKKLEEMKKTKKAMGKIPAETRYAMAKTPTDQLFTLFEKLFERATTPVAPAPVAAPVPAPAPAPVGPQFIVVPPWGQQAPQQMLQPVQQQMFQPVQQQMFQPVAAPGDWSSLYSTPMADYGADPFAQADFIAQLATSGTPDVWGSPMTGAADPPREPKPAVSCGC